LRFVNHSNIIFSLLIACSNSTSLPEILNKKIGKKEGNGVLKRKKMGLMNFFESVFT